MAIPDDRKTKPVLTPVPKPDPKPEGKSVQTPAASPADNPYAQYHVVLKGDTLSKIAEEVYGDKMLYPKIFEANRDVLSDPNKIKPGQKLRIP